MNELKLPEPAAELWIATRDILTRLGPPGSPWTVHLGGGTVLAAQMQHRESTDIDVVVRDVRVLGAIAEPGVENLVRRIGGSPIRESQGQIKIEMGRGIIDLNTAPVIPREGHEEVEISGRPQAVLSPTQILRGKFERANNPAPVRDVYDMIRATYDPKVSSALTAAYGLLIGDEQDAIETDWVLLDEMYEQQAADELILTEETRADLGMLGSTAALALNNHRLARLVLTLEGTSLEIERTTRNGTVFTDSTTQDDACAALDRLGVNVHMGYHKGSQADVKRRMADHIKNGRSGVIFDTADSHPEERLSNRNPSMKRTDAPRTTESARSSTVEGFLPPSPTEVFKRGIDHSKDTNVVRNENAGPGGTPLDTNQPSNADRGLPKKTSTTYDI